MTKTPLGALILEPRSDLYDNPLEGKKIVRVDALICIKKFWGRNILFDRELVFRLVSGDCDDRLYRKTLKSVYKRFRDFADYADDKLIFGDPKESDITKIIKPVRTAINEQIQNTERLLSAAGGKFLVCSKDYVYFAFLHDNIPQLEGMKVIEC